jgi:hypothetical protein
MNKLTVTREVKGCQDPRPEFNGKEEITVACFVEIDGQQWRLGGIGFWNDARGKKLADRCERAMLAGKFYEGPYELVDGKWGPDMYRKEPFKVARYAKLNVIGKQIERNLRAIGF